MLKGFEEQTNELSDYEKNVIVPILIRGFQNKVGQDKCITNKQICNSLNTEMTLKVKMNEPRIRKCIYYCRKNNLIPRLIATSKGYWIATTKQELVDWATTIQGRINAIQETLSYANNQISKWDNPTQQSKLF